MRGATFWFGAALGALACAAACAASGDEPIDTVVPDGRDGGTSVKPEADAGTDAQEDELEAGAAKPCSPDDWCPTTLPGSEVTIADIHPLETRAFGLMGGQFIGHKVAEWTADEGWRLITKKVQFSPYSSPGQVWAASDDEIYFSVNDLRGFLDGPFGAFIVRGRRPVPPATDWTWTTSHIDRDALTYVAPLWATSDGTLYVSTGGQIHRLDRSPPPDAGDPDALRWIAEPYADDLPEHPVEFYAISGTGPDDIWFGGGRANADYTVRCATLVHKSATGYRTVIDGVPEGDGCSARPEQAGVAPLRGAFQSSIFAASPGRVVGAISAGPFDSVDNALVSVTANGTSPATVITTRPAGNDALLTAPWGTSADDLFIIATRTNASAILLGRAIWGSAPSYGYAQLAINGLPNTSELQRIRGTSNHNLWAIGSANAYHKTTP